MRIVVLDGHALNPGDLSWTGLTALGHCTVHDATEPDKVVARAADAEVVLTNKTLLTAERITALRRLRYIGILATGYNVVDIEAAAARQIVVTNVPAYSTASVAQATFALLLELTNRVGLHADGVRRGKWCRSPDFCYWETPLIELAGLTLGIVGLGAIGCSVARLAPAFGMHVRGYTRAFAFTSRRCVCRVGYG